MKRGLDFSWFPRVGWDRFGGGSMRTSTTFLLLRRVGKRNLPHEMGRPTWEWQVPRTAQNEAWGGVWAAHASQEWGGKGLGCFRILGRVKTNHEKGFGFFKGSEGFGGNSMRTSTTSCC